jgi:cysteine desulfurase / selenocysteine lyase
MLSPENSQVTFPIQRVRDDFPFLQRKINGKQLVYLDTAATAQKPSCVIDAITRFYSEYNANIHRGVHTLSREATIAYEEARQSVASFINASNVSEIVFTKGTTESINLVATCLADFHFQSGDEIILTELEHHSNILPWQHICDTRGVHLKIARISDNGEIDCDYLYSLFSTKTKLLAVTHISNTLGVINPVHQIIQIARQHNIPVLIDGAQSIAHCKIDVQKMDCDFFVFSGHKLYAPTGIGILYAKKKWLDLFSPYQFGGGIIKTVSFEKTEFAESPLRFEAGTPNIEGAIGLKTAIDYLTNLDINSIEAYENHLYQLAYRELQAIDDLIVYGHSKYASGSISFNLKNIHPYDVGTLLDQMGIAVRTGHHCTQPLMQRLGIAGTVRASLGIYSTTEEVSRLVEGIKKAKKMLS